MKDSLSRRRQRVQLIRSRVVGGSIALFVAVFGGITAQLASGHDPALSTSSTTNAATSTKTTTQQRQQTQTQAQTQTQTKTQTQQQQQATSPSPVTTRQS